MDDYGKMSREALARVDALSERAIFWSLIVTVVVIAIAMIKGTFGL